MATAITKKPSKPKQMDMFSGLSDEALSYVAATASIGHKRKKKGVWRGMPAVPPASLLDDILMAFRDKTNIALEIPFVTFIHYVAGALIGKNTKIVFRGREMGVDFWTILLAQSGAGKTFTEKEIASGLAGADIPLLQSGAASAAKFAEELEANPSALWVKDEYFQLLKQIDTPGSPLADMKDYLLRAYDNSTIKRDTKQSSICIENPCLSILGFTALKPFVEGMSLESLIDGFAQRFGYMIARPDPLRRFEDYPVWTIDKTGWRERFDTMLSSLKPVYVANEAAEKKFIQSFKKLIGGVELDESFYRRILWRGHKYALVYHILRGQGADEFLTEEDYGWATRLLEIQLADAADLIDMVNGTDLSRAITATEEVVAKLIEEGKPITARAVIARTRQINNVGTARLVFKILDIAETK